MMKLSPVSIMCDFEKAAIILNAVMRTYPDTSVSGCFFRFCQSSYRKIVSLDYKNQYHNDNTFNLNIRCFAALIFLPYDDVISGFEELG